MKFLIDWRQHQSSSLFTDELACWQGPALIAYNNAVFSDQDLEHIICELAGETKMKDLLKTGQFGVGFCVTYFPSVKSCYCGQKISVGSGLDLEMQSFWIFLNMLKK